MTTTLKTLMMRLKLHRTAAAAVVAARAPSPRANERGMAKKGKTATCREQVKKYKRLLFKFTARRRCTAVPIYYYSFCIVYKYVVLSAGTKDVPRALCLISHIPRRFQAS